MAPWLGLLDNSPAGLLRRLRENDPLLTDHFTVSGCGPEWEDERVADGLTRALLANSSVRSLSVPHGCLRSVRLAVATALAQNKALESLEVIIDRPGMDDGTGQVLADALRVSSRLPSLTVRGHGVGEDTGCMLAAALRVNNHLRCLTVDGHSVGDATGRELALALRINTGLRCLRLLGDRLTDATGRLLAEGLRANGTLLAINLRGEGVTDTTASLLAEALGTNASLRVLRLHGAGVTEDSRCLIAEGLRRNRRLPECWRLLSWALREGRVESVRAAVEAMTYDGLRRRVFAFLLPEGAAWRGADPQGRQR